MKVKILLLSSVNYSRHMQHKAHQFVSAFTKTHRRTRAGDDLYVCLANLHMLHYKEIAEMLEWATMTAGIILFASWYRIPPAAASAAAINHRASYRQFSRRVKWRYRCRTGRYEARQIFIERAVLVAAEHATAMPLDIAWCHSPRLFTNWDEAPIFHV